MMEGLCDAEECPVGSRARGGVDIRERYHSRALHILPTALPSL